MPLSEARREGGGFHAEAVDVLGDIHRAFSRVLATLGVRRPVDLQRLLNIDSKLSCYICKVVEDGGALASGPAVPSRLYVKRFVKGAAKAGVPADEVAALTTAYDRFEALVERHAGDRTSFNSLVLAAADPSDDWLAANLQHRRNMFRGECDMMGVHAQTRLSTYVLDRLDDGRWVILSVTGYVGLRVLRPADRVRVQGVSVYKKKDGGTPTEGPDEGPAEYFHDALMAGSAGSFLLTEFCSQPVPAIQMDRGGHGDRHWVQTSLVRPQVGNLGLTTVMFGERCVYRGQMPETLSLKLTLPVEVSVLDLLVGPGLLGHAPRLNVFRGDDLVTDRAPDLVPLPGKYKLQSLGTGTGNLATPDVPRYPDLIRAAAARDLERDVESFECWRVRLEYPVYQSTCRLELSGGGSPATPSPD